MSDADPTAGFALFEGSVLARWVARWPRGARIVESAPRRACLLALFAWAPLAALSILDGRAVGGVTVPFFSDLEVQARLLIALPLLVLSERFAHNVIGKTLGAFLKRDIVRQGDRGRFATILADATRWNLSAWFTIVVAATVLLVGRYTWTVASSIEEPTWYGQPGAAVIGWTAAGRWMGFVAVPLFQFLLLRWYLRLILWTIMLIRVTKLDLHLVATHPDGVGGLGFLNNRFYAFYPFLNAHGWLFAGILANRIFHEGGHLPEYRWELAIAAAVIGALVLGPLTAFTPRLVRLKHAGPAEFGTFASRYVGEFEARWLTKTMPIDAPPIGSADIQSLADLGNSYEIVRKIRWFPFSVRTAGYAAVCVLAPMLPLTLTMFSVDELAKRLLQMVF